MEKSFLFGGYEFYSSLSTGKAGETQVDSYFSTWYDIETVPLADEIKRGIDRIYRTPENTTYSVEIKTDRRAQETGNAFVETVANDVKKTPGWAKKSQAQILAYYVNPEIYILDMVTVKRHLGQWEKKYRTVKVPNRNKNGDYIYSSHGILVPLEEFRNICLKVVNRETAEVL